MTKILFLHNTVMPYRLPFFKMLNTIYDIKFIFTRMEISKNVYGIECNEINELKDLNYISIKKFFRFITLLDILLISDCEIIVDSLEYTAPLSFIIAKLRKKPIIFWSEEWNIGKIKTLRRRLISPIFNFILLHSDALIVPGSKHKLYFISLGVSPDKLFIMPNVSNIKVTKEDYKTKEKLKENLNIKENKVVLYVGRLVERKGVEYLIEAFANLKKEHYDTILIIIGRGESKDKLMTLTKNLNISDSVYFVGYIDDKLLPAYYLLCNVCVVPSIMYGMGDPWVFIVNEAMYFGKPVIATYAVGAAYDMIKDHKNGFIIPEKNSDALHGVLKIILSDPVLELEMCNESKKIIDSGFRYEHMVEGFRKAVEYINEKRRQD